MKNSSDTIGNRNRNTFSLRMERFFSPCFYQANYKFEKTFFKQGLPNSVYQKLVSVSVILAIHQMDTTGGYSETDSVR
jgi:hypothetical protein